MNKNKEEAILTSHIDELKEKMRILQHDRKANIEVLEANKAGNKEDIKRLREENKEFRLKLAQLQRAQVQDVDKDEQKHLERELQKYRHELDELHLKSSRLSFNLNASRDTIRDLELASQRPHMEDNNYTRRIRNLENKLDKAMIKYNEAISIKKTYEQIVKRLSEERIGFDNQLSAIEKTLSAKSRDLEELIILSGDAQHSRETALNELERVRAGYEEEHKRREKEIKERQLVIQLRKSMLERIKNRELMRQQLQLQYQENLNIINQNNLKNLQIEKLKQKNKIDIYENAFRKIKEATGVSDVNDVITKIISQESTTENLINLTNENNKKLENLNNLKKELKLVVEELKYSGVSGNVRRKLVDEHEDQLVNSTARLERNRIKYDRLSKLLISVKSGISHLADKLDNLKQTDPIFASLPLKSSTNQTTNRSKDVNEENILDIIHDNEIIILNLMHKIKINKENLNQSDDQITNNLSNSLTNSLSNASLLDNTLLYNTNRPYNQRIAITPNNPLDYNNDDDNDDNLLSNQLMNGTNNDYDDEEMTREKIKKLSEQILLTVERKNKKINSKNKK
uniref:ODAD1 central coiled coil region domain-containing protein n=1 Tax=Chromulina nebulosa TaxID=96789 RepID=A0A7S0SSE8_9STRA|mmetsp:Transcript_1888/g.1692  ORF Transcript_1888/g.1692 Transcript_1888/m.1692 type:complete len:572 (+) Transcript_1888:35-1750(+)